MDVRVLSKAFLRPQSEKLLNVFYFSAYADHMPEPIQKSQKSYEALKLRQTTPVLGQFKKRERQCPSCKHRWIGHEEKETDVNLCTRQKLEGKELEQDNRINRLRKKERESECFFPPIL